MEILILNARTHMETTSTQYENLSKEAVHAIRQVCLGVKGITPHELAELLKAIADAPLDEKFRSELRDLFNEKLSNDPSICLRSSTCNKVDFPENYLRKQDWDQLMDSGADVNSKLCCLANLWANLGLDHPTEKSARNIAALGVLTEQEVVIAGPMGVQHLRTFKRLLKDFAVKVRATTMFSNAPEVYTGVVDQLQQSFPQWYNNVYSESNPVGCPPHLQLNVKRMQATMGCRSSKTGCVQLGKASDAMSKAMQMFIGMQMTSQQQREAPIPGLVVYGRQRSGDNQGQESQGLLALPAPASALTLPSPATTALPAPAETLALPAPTCTAASSQGLPGSQHAVGKHVAALQAILAQGKQKTDVAETLVDDLPDGDCPETPAKTTKRNPKTRKTPQKKVMKRPAAVKGDKSSSTSSLQFPGTQPRPPLIFGKSKVYFSEHKFRLMERMGDRVDKAFSHKNKDAKEVWKMVVKRLEQLNPHT